MSELVAKRLGLLRELLPAAARVGALVNPNAATAEDFVKDFAAADNAGKRLAQADANPVDSMPMQNVPPEAALLIAELMGCRLRRCKRGHPPHAPLHLT